MRVKKNNFFCSAYQIFLYIKIKNETGNKKSVMEGKISLFINAFLAWDK